MSKRRKRKVKECPGGYPSAWYWLGVHRYDEGWPGRRRTINGALLAASGAVEQGRYGDALDALWWARRLYRAAK